LFYPEEHLKSCSVTDKLVVAASAAGADVTGDANAIASYIKSPGCERRSIGQSHISWDDRQRGGRCDREGLLLSAKLPDNAIARCFLVRSDSSSVRDLGAWSAHQVL